MNNTTKLTKNEAAILKAFPTFQFVRDNSLEDLLADGFGRSTWTWSFTDDAAGAAGISLKAVKGVISSMVKKGLVTCENDGPADERTITVTDAGLALVVALQEPEAPAEPEEAPAEDGDEQPEVAASGTYAVEWPESVARLFFRALAKDGTGYIVEARGLTRFTNNSQMLLTITGDDDKAMVTSATLPLLFADANEALKQWRKTNDNYRRFLPLTKATAGPAFKAEQDYLREFCRAVTGVKASGTNPDGYAAGLAYAKENAR